MTLPSFRKLHGHYFVFGLTCLLLLWGPGGATALAQSVAASGQIGPTVEARRGMVVCVAPPAAKVGLDTLKRGGSAVDATVAVAFALAVTWPEAGNIGGGGFMLVTPQRGSPPVCIDYREMAPASATRDMFAHGTNYKGHRVVGVPGTVAGMALAHQRYGRLSWQSLIEPAALLARDGFEIDAALARGLNGLLAADGSDFPELERVFAQPNGGQWQPGDRLLQPELAVTLERIAKQGPDAFYRGAIAQQIVAEMRAGRGLVTFNDLAAYRAVIRDPVRGRFGDFDVYGPPPPSSGGIVVVQTLNILEALDLPRRKRWSSESPHLIVEAMRRSYCDRARYLGDPDFVQIPSHLTNKAYARQLALTISDEQATASEELAPELAIADEGASTTHFSIVDQRGMAVSNTYTIERSFGSRVVVSGAGFLLNNEMTDFNHRPGYTERTGMIGTEANTVAPRKRMLSSMCPVIVTRRGQPVLLTGSPGGRTIPNTVLNVVLGVCHYGEDLRAAVDAPRLHHSWFPDAVFFEATNDTDYADIVAGLRERNHIVRSLPGPQGDAHSIWVDGGLLIGVADQRRTAAVAAGW